MTQSERRRYLIEELLSEQSQYRDMEIPDDMEEQKRLLRSLMNIRAPRPIGKEFLKVQDEYLSTEVKEKGITDCESLPASPVNSRLILWRGDYHIKGRCDCKCRQQHFEGMFRTLPFLRG